MPIFEKLTIVYSLVPNKRYPLPFFFISRKFPTLPLLLGRSLKPYPPFIDFSYFLMKTVLNIVSERQAQSKETTWHRYEP